MSSNKSKDCLENRNCYIDPKIDKLLHTLAKRRHFEDNSQHVLSWSNYKLCIHTYIFMYIWLLEQ